MAFVNNVLIIRRDLITRMAELYRDDRLAEGINRLPLEITARQSLSERCCIHKARAVVKYKIMAIMGFGREEERDELDMPSDYVTRMLDNDHRTERYLTVVDEACTSCVKSSYVVSNLCKGCIAHPCISNCPKKAITRNAAGQAVIDPGRCVNCGICKSLCPYHSIIYMPVPCEEVCPVGAIGKNESGNERIDQEKCILCGKCINACPFGSIMEKTDLFDIMRLLRERKPVNAIVAPSVYGQYSVKPGAIEDALHRLGFSNVFEVAAGAALTAREEAQEVKERRERGDGFTATSCCPSWVMAVDRHIPAMKAHLSSTPSPMAFTAGMCRSASPGVPVVFIGPCLAKRKEAHDNPDISFTMTFEELGCLLNGWKVPIFECDDLPLSSEIKMVSRNFCLSGGATEAIKQVSDVEINATVINGIDAKQLKLLAGLAGSNGFDGDLMEVMTCEGGCIAGPCSHEFPRDSKKFYGRNMSGLQ